MDIKGHFKPVRSIIVHGASMSHPSSVSATTLILMYVVIFSELGISMPFWPVWLQEIGLTGVAFGVVTAIPMLFRVIFGPWLGVFLARRQVVGYFVASCAFCAAILMLCNAFFQEVYWAILATFFMSFAALLALPVTEGEAVSFCRQRNLPYGYLRSLASFVFLVANVGIGVLIDGMMPGTLPILLSVPLFGMAILFIRSGGSQGFRTQLQPLGWSALLAPHQRVLRIVLIAAALIQSSHAAYYVVGSIIWTQQGYSPTAIGIFWALGVMAEILLFMFWRRGKGVLNWRLMLMVAAALSMLRWLSMALTVELIWVILGQILHAASFALTHLAWTAMLRDDVEDNVQLVAQTSMGALSGGLFMAIGAILSGAVEPFLGAGVYLLMICPCLTALLMASQIKKGA
ncbi:MAG: hypothetical protein EBT20_03820 [Alphaproteobacteria bacterium]|nr:hypothetical protein [Alphaproteobacteria bacterium]